MYTAIIQATILVAMPKATTAPQILSEIPTPDSVPSLITFFSLIHSYTLFKVCCIILV